MANFRVQARVLDLLGEEQIADLPTAISELFKNAFDAYASRAVLDVYPDEESAILWDDGCGMSESDLLDRWLVVGTPSKKDRAAPPPAGIAARPVQGEKGIGRLAISRLGDTLLLVTRKPHHEGLGLTALFLNWNLAKNHRLLLSQLEIPVLNFSSLDDLDESIVRLLVAEFIDSVQNSEADDLWATPFLEALRAKIVRQCRGFTPNLLALRRSALATSEQGTSFVIADLHPDIGVYVSQNRYEKRSLERDDLILLLSNYTDRFSLGDSRLELGKAHPTDQPEGVGARDLPFEVDVRTWTKGSPAPRSMFDEAEIFGPEDLEVYDHYVDVHFDRFGGYSGLLTRFGDRIPLRYSGEGSARELACGPFSLTFWYWQGNKDDTSLSPEQHASYKERLDRFGGLMLYRSGLRVLPYGKVSFDWLRLEEARSKHAGRAFFSYRRMFGYVSITQESNPRLRDKAGREGLINNAAFRQFRETLSEFFREIAIRYFFENEDFKARALEVTEQRGELVKASRRAKARRQALASRLKSATEVAEATEQKLRPLIEDARRVLREQPTSADVGRLLSRFDDAARSLRAEMAIPSTRGLGLSRQPKLNRALEAREMAVGAANATIAAMGQELVGLVTNMWPDAERRHGQGVALETTIHSSRSAVGKAYGQAGADVRDAAQRLSDWLIEHKESALRHLNETTTEWRDEFAQAAPLALSVSEMADFIDAVGSQSSAMANEAIQLGERMASHIRGFLGEEAGRRAGLKADELAALRESELERLDDDFEVTLQLAQAGLAAEIADHDLGQTYRGIRASLGTLRAMLARAPRGVAEVERLRALFSHFELQYRQIQPLYRARRRSKEWISGQEILSFVYSLIGRTLTANNVQLAGTEAFETFRVFESTSVVLPVFLNLVDNSAYWLRKSRRRQIRFGLTNNVVTVTDTGPGIPKEMVETVFERFLSTKPRGRGLGLYIAREVLAGVGHEIWATSDEQFRDGFEGACFCIRFSDRALGFESGGQE